MDIFTEQRVIKPTSGKDTALKALIIVVTGMICAASIYLMLCGLGIVLFLAAGLVFGAYYLVTGFYSEYEYIVTNGEMDIDKIIAKRKRKRLITVKASAFERFGKLEEAPEAEKDVTIILATGANSTDEPAEDYYADLAHATYGNIRVIFTPENKVIEALKPYFSRELKISMKK